MESKQPLGIQKAESCNCSLAKKWPSTIDFPTGMLAGVNLTGITFANFFLDDPYNTAILATTINFAQGCLLYAVGTIGHRNKKEKSILENKVEGSVNPDCQNNCLLYRYTPLNFVITNSILSGSSGLLSYMFEQ